MNLSVRERTVLAAVAECGAISFRALANDLSERMQADELQVVLVGLRDKGIVAFSRSGRSTTVTATRRGRAAAEEAASPHG